MTLTVLNDNNLNTLQRLADTGEKFDLIELDGPYGAGLEGWDCLTEDEYLAHYTARLPLVARCLQPWGVSFLFGYPEGCAEIKTWARQSGTLHLRRWLTWYVNRTRHTGRYIHAILVFTLQKQLLTLTNEEIALCSAFRAWLKKKREAMGLKIVDAYRLTGINAHLAHKAGGYLWFENESSSIPRLHDYMILKRLFDIPNEFDCIPSIIPVNLMAFSGVTDLDFISIPVERATQLNDDGLRSKPLGLYSTLFTPVVPPRDTKRALILYGGSGNAAIAAGQLGYDVTVCETDTARCEYIKRRWAWKVEHRDETPVDELGPLFALEMS